MLNKLLSFILWSSQMFIYYSTITNSSFSLVPQVPKSLHFWRPEAMGRNNIHLNTSYLSKIVPCCSFLFLSHQDVTGRETGVTCLFSGAFSVSCTANTVRNSDKWQWEGTSIIISKTFALCSSNLACSVFTFTDLNTGTTSSYKSFSWRFHQP